jgi:hypothetical protein
MDFDAAEGDLLRFDDSPLRSFADVQSALQQTAEGALIQWQDATGVSHGVLLAGIETHGLDASRFLFD